MDGADIDRLAGKGARGIAAAEVAEGAWLGGLYLGAEDGGKAVTARPGTFDDTAPDAVVGSADGILL